MNKVKAIVGGLILTPKARIEDGVIIIEDGKIKSVGKKLDIPPSAEVIEASGKYVIPGLVDGHSHVGMVTDGLEWEWSDVNDYSGPVTAHMRALDGINLYDTGFEEALSEGVTTVYTGPGSSNPLGGIGLIAKTHSESKEKMIIKDFASVKMALGPKRNPTGSNPNVPYPTTRMGTVAMVRGMLARAKDYTEGRLDTGKLGKDEEMILDNLSRLLRGEVSAHIHTSNMPDEIYAVMRLLDEFGFKATMDHGFGSELIAEELAERGIPVIYGPLMMGRRSAGLMYVNDEAPGILTSQGVKVSIMTDNPVIPGKYLRLSACVAVKKGMDPEEALKAITINPAEMIGVGDRFGSIETGKDADIVILSGPPMKLKSRVEKVLIDGEVVYGKESTK